MDSVELSYINGTGGEPKTATMRINQCKIISIKQIFMIRQDASILLRKKSSNEFILPEENGHFKVTPGEYVVIAGECGAGGRYQSSAIANNLASFENRNLGDHLYVNGGISQGFCPTRPPLPRNVSIGAGYASPPIRHSGHSVASRNRGYTGQMQIFQPIDESPVTVYFKLAKWTADGNIAKRKTNEVIEIPVIFSAIDVQSIQLMNDKVSATINQAEDLRDGKNTKYEIYKPNLAKLRDCPEIHTLAYWAAESKKKSQAYLALPEKPPLHSSSNDSDEELEGTGPKKRSRANADMQAARKKVMNKVATSMQQYTRNLLGEQNIQDMLERLENRFTCAICKEIVKQNPVVCLKCGLVVGCEKCHCALVDNEIKDDDGFMLKEKGEWKCPICRFPPFSSDRDWSYDIARSARKPNFIIMPGFDFLANVAKWAATDKH